MDAAALTALLGSGTGGGQLLNTAVGVGSGIFGSIGANRRQRRAIAAQKEENERARQFNRQMAEWYNEQQRLNIADERAYNTPSAVMARLKDAGLNPDLIYAGGAGSLVDSNVAGTALPDGVAPADVASPIMGTPTMMESLYQGAAFSRMMAETKNIQADTAKKEGEADSLDIDNYIKGATTGETIKLAGIDVRLRTAQAEYTEEQKKTIIPLINQINSNTDLLKASRQKTLSESANLDATTLRTRIGAYLDTKQFELQVREFQQNVLESNSRIRLSNAQATKILATYMAELYNIQADTTLKLSNVRLNAAEEKQVRQLTSNLKIQGDAASFELSQDQKFDSAERIINMAVGVTEALYKISDGLSQWIPAPGKIIKKVFTESHSESDVWHHGLPSKK